MGRTLSDILTAIFCLHPTTILSGAQPAVLIGIHYEPCSASNNMHKEIVTDLPLRVVSTSGNTLITGHYEINCINKIIVVRYLSSPEKQEHYHRLHSLKESTVKRLHRLQKKLEEALDKQGVDVCEDLHGDLDNIMQEHSPDIASKFPADSFQRIFWDQQQQANSAKKAQGRRWHPLMIKWCLYLRHVSSRGYEVLRNSGVINLPSQRTLRDYTHFLESVPGFSADVDQMLMEVSKVSSCEVIVIIQVLSFFKLNVCRSFKSTSSW